MKIWRILAVLFVISAVLITSPVGATDPPSLYEELGAAGDGDSIDIYGAEVCAEIFTVASAHDVSAVMVELKKTGTLTGYIKVALKAVSAGVPSGADLSVGYIDVDDITTTYTWYQADITDYSLSVTDYAIVVSYGQGTNANYVEWHDDTGGGGASTGYALHSHDTGYNWTSDTPHDLMTKVYGSVVFDVVGANVFEDYLTDGDWLVTAECINDYPVYSNTEKSERYFDVQLLNVAGTVVLAATTLKSWGDAPCAIYLSPTMVSSLTNGAAYIIRMIGKFTGTPSTSYTLQNSATNNDWMGSDLRYLDSWCIKVAKNMNSYEGNTANIYTTKVTGIGEVLTTYGGSDFTVGIPQIMKIRPDLFESTVREPDYDTGTASNTFDNAHTWQNQVGATIAADATVFGTLFGISAKQFLSIGIWGVYAFCMLFVFASKGGAETIFVMIVCLPILLIGLQYRIIEIQVFTVACAVALLLFVVKMWFTK